MVVRSFLVQRLLVSANQHSVGIWNTHPSVHVGRMPEHESLANPPVEEAIVTMRLSPLDDVSALVGHFAVAERERFPSFDRLEAGVDFVPALEDVEWPDEAYGLYSPDGVDVIRITDRTFSYHRLRPYPGWEVFGSAVRRAWSVFAPLAPQAKVESLQLRFLNLFELPTPFEEWGRFLQMLPAVPPTLRRGMQNYMLTLNLMDATVPADASLRQLTHTADGGAISIVLDVDVRTTLSVGTEPGDERMWRTLERMREYKNRVFFDALTEEGKELFR